MKGKTLSVINIIAYSIMIIVNAISLIFPFGGQTVKQVSDHYPVLFKPANYAFAIWGLIYLLLLGFIIYTAIPKNRNSGYLQKIGLWFAFSCLFNCIWILFFEYEKLLFSVLAIIALLVCLIRIFIVLHKGKMRFKDILFIRMPFSFYLSWVTVATIANISIYLYSIGFNGFGISDVLWTCLLICFAFFVGIFILYKFHDYAFSIVLVWAFLAIAAEQSAYSAIVIISWMCAIALVVIAIMVNLFSDPEEVLPEKGAGSSK